MSTGCAAGATVNVIVEDDKSIKDGGVITIPGHKEKHNTVINVPGPDKVGGTSATVHGMHAQKGER